MSAFTNDWFFFFSLLLNFPILSFTSSIFHKITDYFTQNTNSVNKRTGWRTMDWCGKRLAELYILLLCCCGARCAMKFITLSLTRCILIIVLLIRPFNTLIIDFEAPHFNVIISFPRTRQHYNNNVNLMNKRRSIQKSRAYQNVKRFRCFVVAHPEK